MSEERKVEPVLSRERTMDEEVHELRRHLRTLGGYVVQAILWACLPLAVASGVIAGAYFGAGDIVSGTAAMVLAVVYLAAHKSRVAIEALLPPRDTETNDE